MSTAQQPAHPHFASLRASYEQVGQRTWTTTDFIESNLEVSRNLYTPESLRVRRPRPKELEVFALLSGLPFRTDFVQALVGVQQRISALLTTCLHYWVSPANLGVEYCVFKWPSDAWNPEWLSVVRDILTAVREPVYRFEIRGVQINPDGCVVAKGFDENGVLFRIRERMKSSIPFLPAKQSGWAHVPLGRILEPLGSERFSSLARLCAELSNEAIAATQIESLKLVHETRWYMEEKTVVGEYFLMHRSEGASR